ncbi:hypothetical protein SAMN06269185_1171 [Natronoarchaeum philippinense]|uniref:Uncharacterized protein n=1 Tax=Natronoarchaeum philippinense TaxID=558529 RepID=A0A285NAH4_NATPI|nr:hypothetical protein [Natronoarchaeum philippinense]SNZ06439.1 hypothetical protein SAMN06269185_1171 [Natronoarchaeum philippinense]
MSSQSRTASSKRAGERAEGNVIDAVPELAHLPDTEVEHVDAEVETAISPRPALPTVALPVVEQGTLVEIKSAMVRLDSGGHGRFYLRREQHKAVLDAEGVYLFAVCEPTPDRAILALKFVPATSIDDVVSSWRRAGPDRPEYTQLRWGRIFDADEIGAAAGGDRRGE